jgi:hypothetical protein
MDNLEYFIGFLIFVMVVSSYDLVLMVMAWRYIKKLEWTNETQKVDLEQQAQEINSLKKQLKSIRVGERQPVINPIPDGPGKRTFRH